MAAHKHTATSSAGGRVHRRRRRDTYAQSRSPTPRSTTLRNDETHESVKTLPRHTHNVSRNDPQIRLGTMMGPSLGLPEATPVATPRAARNLSQNDVNNVHQVSHQSGVPGAGALREPANGPWRVKGFWAASMLLLVVVVTVACYLSYHAGRRVSL